MIERRCRPVVRSDDRSVCSVMVRHRCRIEAQRRFALVASWAVASTIVAVLAAIVGSARG